MRRSVEFAAIGTRWQLESDVLSDTTLAEVHRRIDVYDRTYSRFRDDSLIRAMADEPGEYTFPSDAEPLFALYETLFRLTGGAVNPCIGAAIEALGYDAHYSLKPSATLTEVPSLERTVARNGRTLRTTDPVLLDVGAAGKGQLADIVAGILRVNGARDYTVDASGDLVIRSAQPIRVGLEHPTRAGTAIGVAEITDGALCASATNRRRWGDGLHHVLDGRTGVPTSEVIATWVVAADALHADGLATALFFTAPAVLAEEFDFAFVRMSAEGSAEYSADFPGEIFR